MHMCLSAIDNRIVTSHRIIVWWPRIDNQWEDQTVAWTWRARLGRRQVRLFTLCRVANSAYLRVVHSYRL